jgi:hypothetical protein
LSQDPPGWYYVGKGLLRYKFGDFWTDRYKSIDPSEPTAPPADSRSSNPASLSTPPNARRSRPRASRLSIAVCAGLLGLGVGGGLLKPNIPHELVSWAAALKSQVSALLVGPAPPTSATTSDAKAQSKAKAKAKPSHRRPRPNPRWQSHLQGQPMRLRRSRSTHRGRWQRQGCLRRARRNATTLSQPSELAADALLHTSLPSSGQARTHGSDRVTWQPGPGGSSGALTGPLTTAC